MRLDEYLTKHSLSQTAFGAELTPVAGQSLVSQWITGATKITLARALDIAKVTKGAVTIEDCAAMGEKAAA